MAYFSTLEHQLGSWPSWRGLGQVEPGGYWVRGRARYRSGEVRQSWRAMPPGGTWCRTCESYTTRFPNSTFKSVPAGTRINSSTGEQEPWCNCYVQDTTKDQRYDGSAGWELSVPDLIPTTGGTLGGTLILSGDASQLQEGQDQWVYGHYTDRKPSNLCAGCGWAFQLEKVLPPGVTPEQAGSQESTQDTGAIDQDSPEMVAERLKASEELYGDDYAGELADKLDTGELTPEQAAEDYRAEQERRAREQAEREAALQDQEPGAPGAGEEGGAPGLTTAGMGLSKQALVVGGLLLLPFILRDKGGPRRWS